MSSLLRYIYAWFLPLLQIYSFVAAQAGFLLGSHTSTIVSIKSRSFRILQKLGEGGYSNVFSANEIVGNDDGRDYSHQERDIYAIKKVGDSSERSL